MAGAGIMGYGSGEILSEPVIVQVNKGNKDKIAKLTISFRIIVILDIF